MKIPCAIYRGGTSKPVFFMADDLPKDAKRRDAIVLEAFGTPDAVCWVMDGNVYVR